MKKVFVHLPLLFLLCIALAFPAAAEGADQRTTDPRATVNGTFYGYGTDGTTGLYGTDTVNGGTRARGTTGIFNNTNPITNRFDVNRNDGIRTRGYDTNGTYTGYNDRNTGTYRARATTNAAGTNWSWLGLLGLIGLAGLFRGNNRERT